MVLRKQPASDRKDRYDLDTPTSSKSQEAAQEAQILGTQASWGERVLHTPASTIEDFDTLNDHDVPPPAYSDSIASSAYGARESAIPAPVREPSPAEESEPLLDIVSTPQHDDEESGTEDVRLIKPGDHQPLIVGKSKRPERRRLRCWAIVIFVFVNILNLSLIYHFVFKGSAHRHSSQPKPTATPGPSESPWPIQREYRQHETSHSITGTYSLYDLLDLSTTSGSISVTINVESGTKPAVLRLSSASGSINLNSINLAYGPGSTRTFDTIVEAKSGSVHGQIPHGNGGTTIVRSKSGSLGVQIVMTGVDNASNKSTILTETQSGSQNVRFQEPIGGGQMTMVSARHVAHASGSLNLFYPSAWLGKLHMKSLGSGGVSANGHGLQYTQRGNREIFAWRGQGDLQVVEALGEASGSIHFNVS